MLIFTAYGSVDGLLEDGFSFDGLELGLEVLLAGGLGVGAAAGFGEVESAVVGFFAG